MSRAHVREVDGDVPEDLPELPLSPLPNYVTPRGLALLRRRLDDAGARLAALPPNAADAHQARAPIERERRWLQARLASAQCIDTSTREDRGRVAFGAAVTLLDSDGEPCRYRIVGEDEAEPEAGRISWTSPLARALIGARLGEVVTWARPAGDLEVEIQAIEHRPETST
ncbi:MAG: GreA/GreB family elongation factor [Nevskia sp.]